MSSTFNHLNTEIVINTGDCILGMKEIAAESVDLVVADPPYRLFKDYGNDSDKMEKEEFLKWNEEWIKEAHRILKPNGSFYIFCSWQFSPELFVMCKKYFRQLNEIIWDRVQPSQGGSTRKFSSVHDNIGFFVKGNKFTFNLDDVRIPYTEEMKKKRWRKEHDGAKWLEMGKNPQDIWTFSKVHFNEPQRTAHPTQKPLKLIERIVLTSSNKNDLVLDPFLGSGTTAEACLNLERNFIGFELNPDYVKISEDRIQKNIDFKNSQLNFGVVDLSTTVDK